MTSPKKNSEVSIMSNTDFADKCRECGAYIGKELMKMKEEIEKSENDKAKTFAELYSSLLTPEAKDDPVHPSHYGGKIQCWDAMEEAFGIQETMIFCKLNAFKYLWRCDRKNGTEDIKKAKVYLEKYLELDYKLESKGE